MSRPRIRRQKLGTKTGSVVREAERELEPTDAAPRFGRAFLRDHLREWDAESFEDPAVLVLTELVTNVVKHAGTPVRIRASLDDHALRVEVRDGSSVVPAIRDLADESGRGLLIVDSLTSEWGIEQHIDGKSVWFTITGDDSTRSGPDRP